MNEINNPQAEAWRLAQRLQQYPELRASVERMLQVVENQRGDAFLADEAEELVVQEMRRYGQEALQSWAERRNAGVERRHAQRGQYHQGEKKPLVAHPGRGYPTVRTTVAGGPQGAQFSSRGAGFAGALPGAVAGFAAGVDGLWGGVGFCAGGGSSAGALRGGSERERGAGGDLAAWVADGAEPGGRGGVAARRSAAGSSGDGREHDPAGAHRGRGGRRAEAPPGGVAGSAVVSGAGGGSGRAALRGLSGECGRSRGAMAAGGGVGGGQATQVHGVGDGAVWSGRQCAEQFGSRGRYLVDFYHVSEYLSAAGVALGYGREWLREQQERLKRNEIEEVLAVLGANQEVREVKVCVKYLSERREQLDYAGALRVGLPIGSGEIESGHRHVIQARLKRSGGWWSEAGASAMLGLRVERANEGWEDYWADQRRLAL